ncbi:MAG: peroxiredoxin [Deltaproteobacteria bacterium]|nr:peroxiredoxin [Deltaproteobacteria bacterium]
MKTFAFLFSGLLLLTSVFAFAGDEPRRVPLNVGDEAPNFTLKNVAGNDVELASFKGKNTVVLYFYPKDFTPGCTAEAESFRDDHERFKKAGAVILGVSVDDLNSHKAFASKYSLPFELLSDVGGNVSRQYGVMGWIMAKRVTYVIGRDGKIKLAYPEDDGGKHSKAVFKAVTELGPGKAPVATKAKAKPKS